MKFRRNLYGFSWDFLWMGGCYEYRIVYDVEGDLHRVIYRFIALAFDSSPINGEGESGWFVLFTLTPPCGLTSLR